MSVLKKGILSSSLLLHSLKRDLFVYLELEGYHANRTKCFVPLQKKHV